VALPARGRAVLAIGRARRYNRCRPLSATGDLPCGSLATLLFAVATASWAQAGTLEKIKAGGMINLGYREASIPFSYVGDNRLPAGYSVELCQRIDAYASDRVILVGLILGSGSQKTLRVSEELYSYEPYALMMRKGDPAFRLAVNRELARLYRSGETYAIYERWLGVLGTPGPLLKDLYFLNGLPE
jgi:ABC-type amino acid transport substrate-binding protein